MAVATQVAEALIQTLGVCLDSHTQRRNLLPARHGPISTDVLQRVACAVNTSHSQHMEDLLLLPSLLRASGDAPGVFIELGALDGIRFTNTLVLERCFGWSGLLIEANPRNFAKLQRSGRRAKMVHSAICQQSGSVKFTTRGQHFAAQLNVMDAKRWKHVRSIDDDANTSSSAVAVAEVIEVPCSSLTALMRQAGFPRAHFLSLDAEGAEHLVLEAVDPLSFDVVMVDRVGKHGNNVRLAHLYRPANNAHERFAHFSQDTCNVLGVVGGQPWAE